MRTFRCIGLGGALEGLTMLDGNEPVYHALTVNPMTPVIGAEVPDIDLRQPLTDAIRIEIRQALNQWKVVCFPGQELTNDQLKQFGIELGSLTAAHPNAPGLPDHAEIWQRSVDAYRTRRSEDKKKLSEGQRPKDYRGWHIDLSFALNPVKYSILYGVNIPPFGGDTVFACLHSMYEGLSEQLRSFAESLDAVHCTDDNYQVQGQARREGREIRSFSTIHPVVTVHPETGKRQLYINPSSMSHIVGMSERESNALLDFFFNEVSRPEYAMRHRWQPGSLVIWDNRAVVHAGPIDYAHFDTERLVRRITIEGDELQGTNGRKSVSLLGERWNAI